jgi:hypothetical protein
MKYVPDFVSWLAFAVVNQPLGVSTSLSARETIPWLYALDWFMTFKKLPKRKTQSATRRPRLRMTDRANANPTPSIHVKTR